jgi:hypothetical protein
LTQPNSEWEDKEDAVYHYGDNFPNYLQIIPGSKAIFYRLENRNIMPIGCALIHSIKKEKRERTTPKGRPLLKI